MTNRKIYDPIQTLPDTKMRFNIAKAKANVKVQDEFVNQLLDIADAAADLLVALDNCQLEKPGSEFEWIGYIEKMRGLLS